MSFLKQLLNPFIEFDDNQKGQPNKPAVPPAAVPPSPPPKPPQAKAPPAAPAAAAPPPNKPVATPVKTVPPVSPPSPVIEPSHHPMIDRLGAAAAGQVPTFSPSGTLVEPFPEHVRYFEQLIDKANQTNPIFHGPDYKEFVDSKIDIDDITDESLKYQTAYNVLKSSGLTREKLLATGQEYISVIGRDLNAFKGAYSIRYKKEIGPQEQAMQKKVEELQALVQRMNTLKAEINQLTQAITVAKENLDVTKNSFLLAGENKQQEIEGELQKIARYF